MKIECTFPARIDSDKKHWSLEVPRFGFRSPHLGLLNGQPEQFAFIWLHLDEIKVELEAGEMIVIPLRSVGGAWNYTWRADLNEEDQTVKITIEPQS